VVLGGGGRDRAYAQGADPVTLDLTASGIEIAVGITPEDGIAGDTFLNAKRGHMVAGGGGDDYVAVVRGTTGAPTVLWRTAPTAPRRLRQTTCGPDRRYPSTRSDSR
jgi:hypothetical protein